VITKLNLNIFECVSSLYRDVDHFINIRRLLGSIFNIWREPNYNTGDLAEHTELFLGGLPTQIVSNTQTMFSTDKIGCIEKLLRQVYVDNYEK
jgi:hypothetical protein